MDQAGLSPFIAGGLVRPSQLAQLIPPPVLLLQTHRRPNLTILKFESENSAPRLPR